MARKQKRYTKRIQIESDIRVLRESIPGTLEAADKHDKQANEAFVKARDKKLGSQVMEEWAIEGKRLRKLAKSERKRATTIEEKTIPRLVQLLAQFDTMMLPMEGSEDTAVLKG